jgi:hypothetical protein
MYSFIVVFTAQILALVVSKFILIWKMRKMVDENNQARRSLLAVFDTGTLKRAEAAVAQATREDEEAKKAEETLLTPQERMQRQVKAIRFLHRLESAVQQRESVDDIILEVSEAVAAHWMEVRWYCEPCRDLPQPSVPTSMPTFLLLTSCCGPQMWWWCSRICWRRSCLFSSSWVLSNNQTSMQKKASMNG